MTDAEREYEERFGFLDKIVEKMGISKTVNWGHEIREFFKDQVQRAEQRGESKKFVGEICDDVQHHDKLQKLAYHKGLLYGLEVAKGHEHGNKCTDECYNCNEDGSEDSVYCARVIAESLRKEAEKEADEDKKSLDTEQL